MLSTKPEITSGPGSTAKALGIDRCLNGKDLTGEKIWIEDRGIKYTEDEIAATPRAGIAYAQEHALLHGVFFCER